MLGPIWAANIALAAVNMCVVAGVLYIYTRNFSALRSKLALGLIAFSSILVIQNVAAALMYWQLAQAYSAAVAIPILVITALETTGLLFLFWVTWR
jgi:hypothetical protein